ncbi:MAG: hypothetical protein IJM39_07590 [Firmicutes bacterium]|nr:hypothetical protein [Bacillota bacterium]
MNIKHKTHKAKKVLFITFFVLVLILFFVINKNNNDRSSSESGQPFDAEIDFDYEYDVSKTFAIVKIIGIDQVMPQLGNSISSIIINCDCIYIYNEEAYIRTSEMVYRDSSTVPDFSRILINGNNINPGDVVLLDLVPVYYSTMDNAPVKMVGSFHPDKDGDAVIGRFVNEQIVFKNDEARVNFQLHRLNTSEVDKPLNGNVNDVINYYETIKSDITSYEKSNLRR